MTYAAQGEFQSLASRSYSPDAAGSIGEIFLKTGPGSLLSRLILGARHFREAHVDLRDKRRMSHAGPDLSVLLE